MEQKLIDLAVFKRILLWGIIVPIGMISCDKKIKIEEEQTLCLDSNFIEKIELKSVEKKPIQQQLHVTGRVETHPDEVVPFTSLVGGLILNTSFTIGDSVAQGQVLAEVRSADLTSLQNEQKKNKSSLGIARYELEKIQSRYDSGFSSQSELLEQTSKVEQLENDIAAMEETLSLYNATNRQGVFQIQAPVSGFIVEKNINTGQRISAESEPLFVISNLETVWVVANLHASDVSKVNIGDEAIIETLAYPDVELKGKIGSIAQVFDMEEQVLKARIPMENAERKLIPGSVVDIWLHTRSMEQLNAVDTQAVIFDNNRYKIVLYKEACDVRALEIHPVVQNSDLTYFKEEIGEDEKYISENQLLIYNHLNE